nr:MAG TPA: protein of unknown function DUF4373 [Caudoviricetes sp.]
MARPISKGVDYFPLDVGFLADIKVRKIMVAHKSQAIAVLIYILSNIYKDEGYFMKATDDEINLIAFDTMMSVEEVSAIIQKACEVDFFSMEMFEKYQILTSKGIQSRYTKITERRKKPTLLQCYCLHDDYNNSVNADIMSTETQKMSAIIPQSKVKKRKEKEIESKENKSKENKSKEKSFMQPVFNNWINNFGDISSYLMEVLESLVLEYGVDEVLSALEVAKNKGTTNVKYIEGVLKNRKIQSYADDRKSAKKDEQVDWDKESARVHGAT